MERRTFVRLLIAFGIGIPVAIEGATFLGLVGSKLRPDNEPSPTEEATTTRAADRIGVGDELLPETTPTDRLLDAAIHANAERWRVELTVKVDNTLDTAYELRLGELTTDDGQTIDGGETTGPMASGTTTTITGTWTIPSGTTPDTVTVTALVAVPGADRRRRHTRRVPLEKIPVQGG